MAQEGVVDAAIAQLQQLVELARGEMNDSGAVFQQTKRLLELAGKTAVGDLAGQERFLR